MNDIYPLIFKPIPLEKELWGGDRLAKLLKKDFPPTAKIGESWELSDYPGLETVVADGPLAGRSLRQLTTERTREIVGDESILQAGRFPLLVKYIDARQTLSVQVHPDDDYAREHENASASGKKEAWYIIQADDDAKIIRGLHHNTTREKFADAVRQGELEKCLHMFAPAPGDLIDIPWGMVHAIGAGILMLEIQQTSDITYRVYDWNREDEQGRPRDLHIEHALNVIKFEPPAEDTVKRELISADGSCKRYSGVQTDKFIIEIFELAGKVQDRVPENRFAILNVVAGDVVIEHIGGKVAAPLGSTVLIPAALKNYSLGSKQATVLKSFVP